MEKIVTRVLPCGAIHNLPASAVVNYFGKLDVVANYNLIYNAADFGAALVDAVRRMSAK